jgi:hypothetical protein
MQRPWGNGAGSSHLGKLMVGVVPQDDGVKSTDSGVARSTTLRVREAARAQLLVYDRAEECLRARSNKRIGF